MKPPLVGISEGRMMAHPPVKEAAIAPVPQSTAEKAAAFEEYLFDDEQEEAEEAESVETDEAEIAEDEEVDETEEADEPDTAIEAPISLSAEEKAVFAQLPQEAQQAWAASETRRNTQVQEATTRAADAQRAADARAANADAEAKQVYAQQLEQFVSVFAPKMPPAELAQQNPQAYIAQEAQYRAQKAQHDELVQLVKTVGAEANNEAYQAFVQQRDRELLTIPEIANPETRQEYLGRIAEIAIDLGYDPGELAQGMQLRDVQALNKVLEYKAKAEKYDQAVSKRMQKVRSAKSKNLRPNAAPHANARSGSADKSWQRVKQSSGNKAAQADAMAEYLEAAGHL